MNEPSQTIALKSTEHPPARPLEHDIPGRVSNHQLLLITLIIPSTCHPSRNPFNKELRLPSCADGAGFSA